MTAKWQQHDSKHWDFSDVGKSQLESWSRRKAGRFFHPWSFFVPFSFEVSSGDGRNTWSCCWTRWTWFRPGSPDGGSKSLWREFPTLAFHASITNPFGKNSLLNLLRQFGNLLKDTGNNIVSNLARCRNTCRNRLHPPCLFISWHFFSSDVLIWCHFAIFPLLLAVRLHVLQILEVLDLTFSVWVAMSLVVCKDKKHVTIGMVGYPNVGHLGKFGTGETRSRRSTLSWDSFGARFPSSQSSNLTTK